MLTSIEIAKLLKKQQKSQNDRNGFDTALVGLGIALQGSKTKRKYVK